MPYIPNIPVGSNQTSSSWFGSGSSWANAFAAAQAEAAAQAQAAQQAEQAAIFQAEQQAAAAAQAAAQQAAEQAAQQAAEQAEAQALADAIAASEFMTPIASAPTPTNTPAPAPVITTPAPVSTTSSKPVKKKWQESPKYMLFLRRHGIREGEIESTLDAVKTSVAESIARKRSSFDLAEKEQVRATDLGFEERGLFKSGARIRKLADVKDKLGLQEQTEIDLEKEREVQAVLTAEQESSQLSYELDEAVLEAKEWATKENA